MRAGRLAVELTRALPVCGACVRLAGCGQLADHCPRERSRGGDDGFDGITDWEGETNQHYFTKREFNPTFTEDFLKNEVYTSFFGDANWVAPVKKSIRDRVLAQQVNPYARAIRDRDLRVAGTIPNIVGWFPPYPEQPEQVNL